MTKTVSARIPNNKHEELVERCNKVGCTINEWLNAAIDYMFTSSSDFDFGDKEEDEEEESNELVDKSNNHAKKPAQVQVVRIE